MKEIFPKNEKNESLDRADAFVSGILESYDLIAKFPKGAKKEAQKVQDCVTESQICGRTDFRGMTTITIDGDDAKDFDDAVSLEKSGGEYILYVHIADVSEYCKEGSQIDKEAYRRATSVYFPGAVIPMLPNELCNGICSLKMGQDRLALTCCMHITCDGDIASYQFIKSVINSDKRATYKEANSILKNGDAEISQIYGQKVCELLFDMRELAQKLQARRRARGSIDFDLPECEIILDKDGRTADVRRYTHGVSGSMIEEFMLAANECAARFAHKRKLPFLYRVHEEPEAEKAQSFFALLAALGIGQRLPKYANAQPAQFQKILSDAKDSPYYFIISRMMLRSMQKARYCEKNLGHFGLAQRYYCHFTSPIRRYPDLVAHRAIKASLDNDEKPLSIIAARLSEMAEHTSLRERNAMEAERAMDDLRKAEYMQDKVGQRFLGVISGATDFGIFVTLENTVEGMIRLSSINDDYYCYDQKLGRVWGRRNKKIYAPGDHIDIIVQEVSLKTRRCLFVLAGTEQKALSKTKIKIKPAPKPKRAARPRQKSRRRG